MPRNLIYTGPHEAYDLDLKRRVLPFGRHPRHLNHVLDDGTWAKIDRSWVKNGDVYDHEGFFKARITPIVGGCSMQFPVGGESRNFHTIGTRTIGTVIVDPTARSLTLWIPAVAGFTVERPGVIETRDIVPGLTKQYHLNNETLDEQFIFSEGLVATIKADRELSDKHIGVMTKIDTTATLRDERGVDVPLTESGHLTDEFVDLRVGSSLLAQLGGRVRLQSVLNSVDTPPDITVRKWITYRGGSIYLIELFAVEDLRRMPAGAVYHNATFGYESYISGSISIEDTLVGYIDSPSSSGTGDSMTFHLYIGGGFGNAFCKTALYNYVGGGSSTLVTNGSTTERGFSSLTYPIDNEETFVFATSPTITSGASYALVAWAKSLPLSSVNIRSQSGAGIGTTPIHSTTYGASFPTPINPMTIIGGRSTIYVTYTEAAAGKVLIYSGMDGGMNRAIGDMRG